MKVRTLIILIIVIGLLAGFGIYFWYLYQGPQGNYVALPPKTDTAQKSGFTPINREAVAPTPSSPSVEAGTTTANQVAQEEVALPVLRLLSQAPVGGMAASSSPKGPLVIRYIDRGLGHIFQAYATSSSVTKISNTTIPRVYESYWNKNMDKLVIRYMKPDSDTIVNLYGEIRPLKTSTSTQDNTITSEIKGSFLSSNIKEIAVSPKKDKIFTLNTEGDHIVGYVSGFDESKKTKVVELPFTQARVEWPEENTVTITTKASGLSSGFIYFLDIKTGTLKKMFGGQGLNGGNGYIGLTTKTSHDLKRIMYSVIETKGTTGGAVSNADSIKTYVFNTDDSSSKEIIFKTLPEKCVWSNIHKSEAYCAVPNEFPTGLYPDDWYKGSVSLVDKIWHIDTITGEAHLIADLLKIGDTIIDAINPNLDDKENFLFFTNKNDLKLWSLDLTK